MASNITHEAYLKDTGDNAVASGKNIYLRASSIKFGFKNLVTTNPLIFQDSTNTYNEKKSDVTFTGFEQPVISVTGIIDLDITTGSLNSDTDKQIITIGRLFHLAKAERTYQFWDSRITKQILEEPDANAPSPYTGSAIPVIIQNLSFSAGTSLNEVNYSLELIEDKE